jgi:glycosyltransferase involved in cell wall biosynthesis
MRILMVISQFYPMIGGAEKQAQLLAKKLMERGVFVDIVTGWWKLGTAREERVEGVQVFRNFTCWGMFGIKWIRTIGALIYMMSLGLFLLSHRKKYDLIHVHQALYPAFISVLVGKQILRKPVLVKTASSGLTSDFKLIKRFPLGKFQLRYLLKKMDCLVTVSRISGKEYQEIGFPESKIVYIPNGVEVPSGGKNFPDGIKRVVSTSRLSVEKGIDVLLRAWADVVKHEKGLQLIIIGYGPLQSELKYLSQSLGISSSIEFTGRVENVGVFLKNAGFFVLPSRSEGLSNALLEAMSYGLPCIATDVGGNGEVLGGGGDRVLSKGEYLIVKNGILVQSEDSDGLSKAILHLAHNKKEREDMSNKGRLHIQENYSIDLIADRYIRLYQSMLEKRI